MEESPFPKLNRARQLYHQIDEEAQKIVDSETEHEVDLLGLQPDQWDVLRWKRIPGLHPELAVLAGELVHDVRSSLDQLVCELIRERGHSDYLSAQFPLMDSRTRWKQLVTERDPNGVPCKGCGKVDGRASPLHGLTQDQIDFIETTQPLVLDKEDRAGHPLAQLSKFSNEDKHRTLFSCAVYLHKPTSVTYEPEGFYEVGESDFEIGPRPLVVGDVFGRVQRVVIKKPALGDQAKIRVKGPAELAFRVESEPPIATVQDLGRIVIAAAEILTVLSPRSGDRSIGS